MGNSFLRFLPRRSRGARELLPEEEARGANIGARKRSGRFGRGHAVAGSNSSQCRRIHSSAAPH